MGELVSQLQYYCRNERGRACKLSLSEKKKTEIGRDAAYSRKEKDEDKGEKEWESWQHKKSGTERQTDRQEDMKEVYWVSVMLLL